MDDCKTILKDALEAPSRVGLAFHREAITALRAKGYTWRDVAEFLRERGVSTDHTAVYRFMQREKGMPSTFAVPAASAYIQALQSLDLAEHERRMLRTHYLAPNRTITYTQLAGANGWKGHRGANRFYGGLGRRLGHQLGMSFFGEEEDDPFFSSAIGMGTSSQRDHEHFQFVMHHELAKALDQLGWFQDAPHSV